MRTYTRNISACVRNPYQGDYRRVVTVCSGGCLRSPTAAVVLAGDPWNYNTRSAGLSDDFAINQFDEVLIKWADEIVVMESHMADDIRNRYPEDDTPIVILDIKDNYSYRDPELMELIADKYKAVRTSSINRISGGFGAHEVRV